MPKNKNKLKADDIFPIAIALINAQAADPDVVAATAVSIGRGIVDALDDEGDDDE